MAIFIATAAVVWISGTRLSRYVSAIATRTGMGHVFAGFLLLGCVTSLPELASSVAASFGNHPQLALNGLLGSVATNVVLLAVADAVLGRDALTSVVAHPATLLQGALGILLLGVVAAAIAVGDVKVFGIGVWAAALLPLFAVAVWMSSRNENRPTWIVADRVRFTAPEGEAVADDKGGGSGELTLSRLILRTAIAGVVILVAGYLLAGCGDAIAIETGLGSGLVGFLFIGLSTSLPEISSMVGAIRLRRYEMAIGDIFGTNLFDLALIPVADLAYRPGALLATAGRFEAVATALGVILTAIFLIGLIERRNRTYFKMGYDSLAAIIVYAIGLIILNQVRTAV